MNLRALAAVGLAALCAACAGVPPTHYYTLPVPPAEAPGANAPWAALALLPVQMPELLDRPQLLRRASATQVVLAEYDLWAQPLKQEVARAVAAGLAARWPQARVDTGVAPPAGAPRLQLEVLQFEADGSEARVDLAWVLLRAGQGTERGRVAAQAPLAGAGHDAAVQALGAALQRATQALGAQLEALPRSS